MRSAIQLAVVMLAAVPAWGFGAGEIADDPRLPRDLPATAPRAVVAIDVAHLYSQPTADTDVVSQALLGWNVVIIERRDGFARVATPDRYLGWIADAELVPAGTASGYATSGRVVRIASPMALLYREASVTRHAPSARAPFSAQLELVAESDPDGFHRLRLPDQRELYVQVGDVRLADAAVPPARVTGEELVASARQFLGVPYLWGGMSALGIDCSGLVATLYRFQGVEILRDADLQFDDPSWQAVERHALAPGDLVFFGGASISHVGMYAGAGEFVSATTFSRPMVRVDRLDDPYWAPLYRGARRPR